MNTLRNCIAWLKRNALALFGVAGALFGALALLNSKRNQISNVKDALKVEQTRKSIAKDEKLAAELRKQADDKEPELRELEKRIVDSKRRVIEIHESKVAPDASDDDIIRMFNDAGF